MPTEPKLTVCTLISTLMLYGTILWFCLLELECGMIQNETKVVDNCW